MNKRISYIPLYILLGIVTVTLVLGLIFRKPHTFTGTVISPPLPVTDFALQTQNDQTFRLSDVQGKFVLLFFGYTSCPDVCPTTLATLKQVYEQLGNDAESIAVLMVTADPERDTADKISEYVARFNPKFVGLSGNTSDLAEVYDELGVFVEKQDTGSAAGYLVGHTSSIYVLDPNGALIMTFPFETTVNDIVKDITELLKQSRQT
jgi:protein SCO1/2